MTGSRSIREILKDAWEKKQLLSEEVERLIRSRRYKEYRQAKGVKIFIPESQNDQLPDGQPWFLRVPLDPSEPVKNKYVKDVLSLFVEDEINED